MGRSVLACVRAAWRAWRAWRACVRGMRVRGVRACARDPMLRASTPQLGCKQLKRTSPTACRNERQLSVPPVCGTLLLCTLKGGTRRPPVLCLPPQVWRCLNLRKRVQPEQLQPEQLPACSHLPRSATNLFPSSVSRWWRACQSEQELA